MPAVFLLTDFGLQDPYVGQMKAALATLAPGAAVHDLTHGVRRFDVRMGAFFLRASAPHCAPGSVLLGVVDPGVGSARAMALLHWRERWLLGPDNGLLGLFLAGPEVRAWRIPPPEHAPSATFHGRDVFAPLAAKLLNRASPDDLGQPVPPAELAPLAVAAPNMHNNRLTCQALHVDGFGNVVLNIPDDYAPLAGMRPVQSVRIVSPVQRPLEPATHYAALAKGQTGLLRGSQGFYEIAMNQASAAGELNLKPGAALVLEVIT